MLGPLRSTQRTPDVDGTDVNVLNASYIGQPYHGEVSSKYGESYVIVVLLVVRIYWRGLPAPCHRAPRPTTSYFLLTYYALRCACTLPSCITTSPWSSYSSRTAPTAALLTPPATSSTSTAHSTLAAAASASLRAWGSRTSSPTYSPTATARQTQRECDLAIRIRSRSAATTTTTIPRDTY